MTSASTHDTEKTAINSPGSMPISLHVSIPLLLLTILVTSCTTISPAPPQHINLVHRHTVQTTTVKGHTLAYLDEGEGQPIILIHGFGGSMWQWEHQQEELAQHFRVITLDMLGSGLSDKPITDYTPSFMLNSLTEFMDNLDIPQATLIGNSLGAGVAIGMSLTYPERVSKLILIDGFPANVVESIASPSYKRFVHNRPPMWLARFGLWLAGRWATERILNEIIHDQTFITPVVIERSYQNRESPGFLPPLYSQAEQIPEWEKQFAPRLTNITQPTLIIWGTHDKVFPPTVGQTMHATLPHSTFLEVPNAGHIPQWESPQVVNPALLKFLQSN
ncbi:MAG: alpha/beta hydrolase [Nitrospirae bacterium]|nr:alpha/beta hydrolase [Nitrospirota bacterium]MDA1304659.1 alpha/beta hydrolase [Nitrospirota bacterium]